MANRQHIFLNSLLNCLISFAKLGLKSVICSKQNGWENGGINVTSGFRCSKLNKAVGGVSNSAHLYGYAADTQPSNKRQSDYEKFIRDWVKQNPNLTFDQIIVERSKTSRWVHIAIKDGRERQRRQCFDLNNLAEKSAMSLASQMNRQSNHL